MSRPDVDEVLTCGEGSSKAPLSAVVFSIKSIISLASMFSAVLACSQLASIRALRDEKALETIDVSSSRRKLRNQYFQDEEGRKMAWIHIGKCGGTTIEKILRYGCPTHRLKEGKCASAEKYLKKHVESTVSKTVQQSFHVEPPEYEPFNSFLVSTRDPLERTISAFLMHHPKNEVPGLVRANDFIFDCFPSLEDFAMALGGRVTGPAEVVDIRDGSVHDCRKLAKALVLGRAGQAIERAEIGHVFWNYEMYVGGLPQSKEVFAIRMNHLWSDFAKINSMLGGASDEDYKHYQQHARDSSRMKYKVTKDLSAEGQKYICEYLSAEYQLYFGILDRATNLSEDEVMETKTDSWKTCPELFTSETSSI